MVKKEKEVAKKEKAINEPKNTKEKKEIKESKATKKKAVKKKEKPVTTFKNEIKKIKWPTKKEMIKYSIATVVFVIFFALFFYVIEILMALLKSVM